MILSKYIFKEIFKVQAVTLSVLVVMLVSQSVIKYVGRAASGQIPSSIISQMVIYSLPSVLYIMLPLSLFVGVLVALGRISTDSEMVVMRSVGFSTASILKIVMWLALGTAVASATVSLYVEPWAVRSQDKLLDDAKKNPQYMPVEAGRFVNFSYKYTVFLNDVSTSRSGNKDTSNIYLFSQPFNTAEGFVITSTSGHVQYDEDGNQWVHLIDGNRYEGPLASGEFRRMHFEKAEFPSDINSGKRDEQNTISGLTTAQLMESDDPKAKIEIQWRISPIFVCFIMTMVAVPLGLINPRQGRFARLGPAILLYISYYMLILGFRNMMNSGIMWMYPGLYSVPLIFLLFVALPLNTGSGILNTLRNIRKK